MEGKVIKFEKKEKIKTKYINGKFCIFKNDREILSGLSNIPKKITKSWYIVNEGLIWQFFNCQTEKLIIKYFSYFEICSENSEYVLLEGEEISGKDFIIKIIKSSNEIKIISKEAKKLG